MKKKYEVGDKIKFLGWAAAFRGGELKGTYFNIPMPAIVDGFIPDDPESIKIKFASKMHLTLDSQGVIHHRQVTHRIKKKPKPREWTLVLNKQGQVVKGVDTDMVVACALDENFVHVREVIE
jgi:hypothetical protein